MRTTKRPRSSVENKNGNQDNSNANASVEGAARSYLTQKEWEKRGEDLEKLYNVSMLRETAHPQFDSFGYMKWNETNEMADMSFIPKKINKSDSYITTGITHEKDSSILSLLEGFNFEGRVHVFHKSMELYDLSTAMTAWVRKSRELERYDEKRPIFYRNLLVQGTAFVMEKWTERWMPNKAVDFDTIDFSNLEDTDWSNLGEMKVYDGAESFLEDGKKVFLENIREWDIRKQPGVFVVEYPPREAVEAAWGHSKRWKFVPKMVTQAMSIGKSITTGSIYSEWLFGPINENKAEVIHVFKPFENRYQIYINGVPMLPLGFPMSVISPSGLVPIAKGDIDVMNMFAYSKSIPSKTKIDQAVYDSVLKGLTTKFQSSFMGARANLSEMVVNSSMFMPGIVTDGLNPKDVPLINENQESITNGDLSFYKLINEIIDSKSINSILEGAGETTKTLGEYMDKSKKAMLKVGRIIDAVINWEKQMLHLRTINLLANGTKPKTEIILSDGTVENEYEEIAVSDTMDSGLDGTHVLKFTEKNYENLNTPQSIEDEEVAFEQKTGKQVKYSYLNPKMLREMLTDKDYCFYYEVTPVDKNNDKLTQAMFVGLISQAMQLFGPDSLNVQKLKRRYAAVMGEEFDTLFLDEQELAIKQQQAMQQAAMMQGAVTDNPANAGGAVVNPMFQ